MKRSYLLLLIPLGVRLTYLLEISKNPFFNFPIVDCATYDRCAVAIASGNIIGDKIFWQPPLYPYFIGLVYAIFGHSYTVLRVIQIIIGSLSCILILEIGKKIFDKKIGLIAFLITSFYGPLVHFDTELLPATLMIFLMLIALYLIIEKPERPLQSAVFIGLSAITHGIGLILAISFLFWVLFRMKRSFFIALLGILIPIGVVTVRNVVVGHDLVLISYNGGINFYIGNNPDYEYTTNVRPGIEWQKLVDEPIKMGFRKPSAQARYYYLKAFRYITQEPLQYLLLLVRKIGHFLNGNEIMRNQSIYPFRNYSILLTILLFKYLVAIPFGLLLPFAGVGILIAVKKKRKVSILLASLSAIFASTIIFFVVSRYRLPAVPILALFGSYGFYAIQRHRKEILVWIVFASLFLVSNISIGKMSSMFNYDAYYNLAAIEHKRGELGDAEKHYLIALTIRSDLLDARNNLAAIYNQIGKPLAAVEQLIEVLKIAPSHSAALNNLGNTYRIMGLFDLARRKYELALLSDSANREARFNLFLLNKVAQQRCTKTHLIDSLVLMLRDLTVYYADNRMTGSALATTIDLLSLRPKDPLLHNNLGILYYQLGKVDKAKQELRVALRYEPEYIPALLNLARIELKAGNRGRAKLIYQRVLAIDPDNREAKVGIVDLK
ncbi:MAG TPA: tetratricopeptide repeat protein [bacterium (Candidatus Stahlbacteria)]|nr:tetratricopeptide repeat protein [Candidatus Stahlbacteria bacterium]